MSQPRQQNASPIFTARAIVLVAVVFFAALAAVWAFGRLVLQMSQRHGWDLDCPQNFPVGIFAAKIPGVHAPVWTLGIAAAVLLLFALLVGNLRRITAGPLGVLAAGLLLVLATNVIQGPTYGLVNPHQGPRQYYHDAKQIRSAGELLRTYQQRQPELGCHTRTHPPGAVLFFYALAKTVRSPAIFSLVIAALAVGLSGGFFYAILARECHRDTAGYATLLFLLVPGVQVYYCAALDAVIAGCFLAVVYFFRHRHPAMAVAGSIAALFCGSWLTFAACFLLPVIVGVELLTRRSVRRSAAVLLGTAAVHAVVYFALGYNYLDSFRIASALENPGGLMLLAEPANYFLTRLENVCEILLFFGPFLLVLFMRGVQMMRHQRPRPELLAWTALGLLTLCAMFLTGALRTGETARACLFIVPYLMFPVAAYLDHSGRRESDRKLLAWLVFGQSVAMQTFGGYFW